MLQLERETTLPSLLAPAPSVRILYTGFSGPASRPYRSHANSSRAAFVESANAMLKRFGGREFVLCFCPDIVLSEFQVPADPPFLYNGVRRAANGPGSSFVALIAAQRQAVRDALIDFTLHQTSPVQLACIHVGSQLGEALREHVFVAQIDNMQLNAAALTAMENTYHATLQKRLHTDSISHGENSPGMNISNGAVLC